MAAIAKRVITGSTANTNNYATGSFTPTVGDLLFVFSHATASIEPAVSATCTASANGITFTQVARLEHTLSSAVSFIYVADQLVPSSPSSMTVSANHATDPATGCYVAVGAVTGMTKTGATAVLQTALAPNLGANDPYDVTFGSATNTSNPLAGFVGGSVGNTHTPPTGWTELDELTTQTAPTQLFEWASVDSGQTSTTYSWTASGSTVRANVAAIEFDASGGGSAFSANAALSGSGTLSSTRTVNVSAAAGFSGSGTLSSTRVVNVSATAAFTGSGSLTSSRVVGLLGSGALNGVGALSATSVKGLAVTANFSSTGTLSGVGVAGSGPSAFVNFSGSGSLTAAASSVGVSTTATFGSFGSLTAPDLIKTEAALPHFTPPTHPTSMPGLSLWSRYSIEEGISVVRVDYCLTCSTPRRPRSTSYFVPLFSG